MWGLRRPREIADVGKPARLVLSRDEWAAYGMATRRLTRTTRLGTVGRLESANAGVVASPVGHWDRRRARPRRRCAPSFRKLGGNSRNVEEILNSYALRIPVLFLDRARPADHSLLLRTHPHIVRNLKGVSMPSAGITATEVGMTFVSRTGTRTTVIDDLSIEIAPGSFVTLLGPSGCGKSTLLKILGGILEPSSGGVTIGGVTASEAVRRKEIGLVLQRPALLPWKSARENVMLLHEIARKDRKSASRAADAALELVGLTARRAPAAARALGWHGAARLDRPGARDGTVDPAHGRAVRRARCNHARLNECGAGRDWAATGKDHRLRDPLHLGGGLPLGHDPRHGHEPRPHRGHRRHRHGSVRDPKTSAEFGSHANTRLRDELHPDTAKAA